MAALARRGIAGPVTIDKIGDQGQTVPRGQLLDFAGPDTLGMRRLYQYAVEHGDALQYIPCCCGCVNFGHRSNRDCSFTFFSADGTLTFPNRAAT